MNLINQEGFMGAMEAKMTQLLRKGHKIIQRQMCFSSVLKGKDCVRCSMKAPLFVAQPQLPLLFPPSAAN